MPQSMTDLDDFCQSLEKFYNIVSCNFCHGIYADTLNLMANRLGIFPASQNDLAKQISMDLMILAGYWAAESYTQPSSVIYMLRRATFYAGLFSADVSTYGGKFLTMVYNIKTTGLQGFTTSAVSHLGTKVGFFAHEKVLDVMDQAIDHYLPRTRVRL